MNTKDMLLEMLNIYSPSSNEGEIAKLIKEYMVKLDFENPVIDSELNVISVNGKDKPYVFLCGHEDTVPGMLEVKEDVYQIYGRGAVDAKSSLLALILGARKAMDRGFKGKILVSAASGEESDSKGINNILKNYSGYDYAVFGEPGGPMNITAGYKGRLLMKVCVKTGTHHASSSWMEANSVDLLMDLWTAIKNKYGSNKDFNSVTAGITKFNGGQYDNMTPEQASMYIDIRYPKSRSEEDIVNEMKYYMKNILKENYTYDIASRTLPYISDIKSPLVKSFKSGISKNGMVPKLIFKSGSGDMNTLGNEWKIPAITYGPGNTQLSHTGDEVIDIREIDSAVNVISDSLIDLQGNQS
ncbi:M20/M25/M40 family metallo-hydrolase [Ferroplasma sp.]|uniref:M20/M25/M40 family metallo-hydrolase n=1 Tax=Ferroplasma sp. TaxID=2591003 RepID=UPI00307F91FC